MFDGIIKKEDLELFAIKYRDLLADAYSHKLALENTWSNLLKSIEKQKKEIVDSLVPNMEIEVLQKLNSEFTYMNLKFEKKISWFGFKSKTILKGNFTIDEIKDKILKDMNFIKHHTEKLKSDLKKIDELKTNIFDIGYKIDSINIKLNIIYESNLKKLASYNDVKLKKALITLTKKEDDLLIDLKSLNIRRDFPEDENPRLMELWLWYILYASVEAEDSVLQESYLHEDIENNLAHEIFLSSIDEKIDIDEILLPNSVSEVYVEKVYSEQKKSDISNDSNFSKQESEKIDNSRDENESNVVKKAFEIDSNDRLSNNYSDNFSENVTTNSDSD